VGSADAEALQVGIGIPTICSEVSRVCEADQELGERIIASGHIALLPLSEPMMLALFPKRLVKREAYPQRVCSAGRRQPQAARVLPPSPRLWEFKTAKQPSAPYRCREAADAPRRHMLGGWRAPPSTPRNRQQVAR